VACYPYIAYEQLAFSPLVPVDGSDGRRYRKGKAVGLVRCRQDTAVVARLFRPLFVGRSDDREHQN